MRKSLQRSDWSARVRTRGIDWLGTARSLPRTHIPERSEVADACVPQLVACACVLEGSSGVVGTHSKYCHKKA